MLIYQEFQFPLIVDRKKFSKPQCLKFEAFKQVEIM